MAPVRLLVLQDPIAWLLGKKEAKTHLAWLPLRKPAHLLSPLPAAASRKRFGAEVVRLVRRKGGMKGLPSAKP